MARTVHHTTKNQDVTILELTSTANPTNMQVSTLNQISVSGGRRVVQDEFGTYVLVAG